MFKKVKFGKDPTCHEKTNRTWHKLETDQLLNIQLRIN